MDLVDAPNATAVDAIQSGLSTLTQQNVADALKLAPTGGDPAAGSANKHLDDILEDTAAIDALTKAGGDGDLAAIKASIETLSPGTGERTVTYTVTDSDSGNPVTGVTMRYFSDAARTQLVALATGTTLGVVQAWLDDGTYYWSLKASQYVDKTGELTVDGNESESETMDSIVIPSSTGPALLAVYTYVRDDQGTLVGAGDGFLRIKEYVEPDFTLDEDLVAATEQTSDETSAGGLASLVLIRGARYVLEAGTEYKVRTFAGTVPTVAEHAGDSASLSELCDDHDWS